MIGILKSRGFWMIILVGSIASAIVAIALPNEKDKYLVREYGYVCPPASFKRGMPAIINPNDSVGLSDFHRLIAGESDRARFDGIIVKRDWKVGIIQEDFERGLIQVLVDPKGGGDFSKPCWIMNEHLSEKPCNN